MDFSYITQVSSLQNFVVVGTCCGKASDSETFDP
jgi:bacterioferritin-associated ferredoxin